MFAILLGVVLSASATNLGAQEQGREERAGGLPRDVARDVSAVWNAPATRRERGPFTLAENDTVRGDLAVLNGPVTIRGVVNGQVVVINGDATLASTSRIGGNLTVVGGTLDRVADAGRGRGRAAGPADRRAVGPARGLAVDGRSLPSPS